ncbi:four helix bundle protein [Patescibacteria group bacterium]|nr:four helix bundle protein [Patescibacteria group bacterium]MCG2687196.1 four helix bundle protein [Candidatus Parcubacteria bacterium]
MPVIQALKSTYLQWFGFYSNIPKTHRYTLGSHIDNMFIETIEASVTAGFLKGVEKIPYVRLAIRKLDTLKILLLVLYETKSLDNNKYIALSVSLAEAGKMLGGWYGQLTKSSGAGLCSAQQNSPAKAGEK